MITRQQQKKMSTKKLSLKNKKNVNKWNLLVKQNQMKNEEIKEEIKDHFFRFWKEKNSVSNRIWFKSNLIFRFFTCKKLFIFSICSIHFPSSSLFKWNVKVERDEKDLSNLILNDSLCLYRPFFYLKMSESILFDKQYFFFWVNLLFNYFIWRIFFRGIPLEKNSGKKRMTRTDFFLEEKNHPVVMNFKHNYTWNIIWTLCLVFPSKKFFDRRKIWPVFIT